MVLMDQGVIVQGDKTEPVRSWEVVFQTPFGWCPSLAEAAKAVQERDLDPRSCVVPVPLARGDTLHEVLR